MMRKHAGKALLRLLCLTLVLALGCVGLFPALGASAATTPTSLGLAFQGMTAYREGWQYSMGAKGQTIGGVRYSDCAGLIYSYYADCGNTSGLAGGATSQVHNNTVFSNDIREGIPRIHGLVITKPDYYDPYSGAYGHIGIYIGNNEACDNSSYDVDMLWGPVVGSSRGWTAWHVMGFGTLYPRSGWFQLDGKYVHYTNYQYDVNVTIDGISIGSDGYARGSVPSSLLSNDWASANEVAAFLRTIYSGVDSTESLAYGGGYLSPGGNSGTVDPPVVQPTYNGKISADSVNVRSVPGPALTPVATLSKGSGVNIIGTTIGANVTDSSGKSSNQWYQVTTASGAKGYISTLYVESVSTDPLEGIDGTPYLMVSDGYVLMNTEWNNAAIYYTTDGSEPTQDDNMYVGPLRVTSGCTFKAIAIYGRKISDAAELTVFSNGKAFTDVKPSSWYFSAVKYAVENELFNGIDQYTFGPGGNMTRGQFVTVLGRLAGVDKNAYTNTRFTDVKSTQYYAPYVAWAAENGIVNGTSDTTFSPSASITREQIATILFNFARRSGNDVDYSTERFNAFADFGACSAYAVPALQWATDKGIFKGDDNNRLNPKDTAKRCEVAAIFMGCDSILTRTTLMGDEADTPAAPLSQSELDAAWLQSDNEDLV